MLLCKKCAESRGIQLTRGGSLPGGGNWESVRAFERVGTCRDCKLQYLRCADFHEEDVERATRVAGDPMAKLGPQGEEPPGVFNEQEVIRECVVDLLGVIGEDPYTQIGNLEEIIKSQRQALKKCRHLIRKGYEVRIDDRWPALKAAIEPTAREVDAALAASEDFETPEVVDVVELEAAGAIQAGQAVRINSEGKVEAMQTTAELDESAVQHAAATLNIVAENSPIRGEFIREYIGSFDKQSNCAYADIIQEIIERFDEMQDFVDADADGWEQTGENTCCMFLAKSSVGRIDMAYATHRGGGSWQLVIHWVKVALALQHWGSARKDAKPERGPSPLQNVMRNALHPRWFAPIAALPAAEASASVEAAKQEADEASDEMRGSWVETPSLLFCWKDKRKALYEGKTLVRKRCEAELEGKDQAWQSLIHWQVESERSWKLEAADFTVGRYSACVRAVHESEGEKPMRLVIYWPEVKRFVESIKEGRLSQCQRTEDAFTSDGLQALEKLAAQYKEDLFAYAMLKSDYKGKFRWFVENCESKVNWLQYERLVEMEADREVSEVGYVAIQINRGGTKISAVKEVYPAPREIAE